MRKSSALSVAGIVIAAALLSACGGFTARPSATPGDAAATEATETAGLYREGVYAAEDADFADSGWKETISIEVGADGKITAVNWDGVHKDGGPTKKELGDDYGMKKASAIGREWYEQANVMEQELIKTQDPAAIPMTDDGYADGVSGCTIHINNFVALAQQALAEASR